MRTCCVAQGTLLSALWWRRPKHEGLYVSMWLSHSAVQQRVHSIVKQLYSNLKKREREKICAVRIVGREDRSNAHSSPEWSGDASRPSLGEMAVADCFEPQCSWQWSCYLSLTFCNNLFHLKWKLRKWFFKCPLDEIQKEQNEGAMIPHKPRAHQQTQS